MVREVIFWRFSPLLFENVEANCTSLRRDVGVPDLCVEAHLGWLEGISGKEGKTGECEREEGGV